MFRLFTRSCEESGGGLKVKDFFLLKGESDRKCELTGGYNTNARWDKGDALKEKQETCLSLSCHTEIPFREALVPYAHTQVAR